MLTPDSTIKEISVDFSIDEDHLARYFYKHTIARQRKLCKTGETDSYTVLPPYTSKRTKNQYILVAHTKNYGFYGNESFFTFLVFPLRRTILQIGKNTETKTVLANFVSYHAIDRYYERHMKASSFAISDEIRVQTLSKLGSIGVIFQEDNTVLGRIRDGAFLGRVKNGVVIFSTYVSDSQIRGKTDQKLISKDSDTFAYISALAAKKRLKEVLFSNIPTRAQFDEIWGKIESEMCGKGE